ncbi:chromosomal replication initiator protein DnaA [Adlercreutzia equolifaciens]|uniref:chromosomal replication initiator protein DnaA n=1 Tax=Adlercreutzia equolifaciens TaxID=446660 RepID=UPI003AF9B9D2
MDSGKLAENWNAVCDRVKSYPGIDPSQVNAFFSRLQPQAMSEGFLMLTADNDFIRSWIERHYHSSITQALTDLFNVPFTVIIEVDPNQAANAAPASGSTGTNVAPAASAAPASAAAPVRTTAGAMHPANQMPAQAPAAASAPGASGAAQAPAMASAANTSVPRQVPAGIAADVSAGNRGAVPSESAFDSAAPHAAPEPASEIDVAAAVNSLPSYGAPAAVGTAGAAVSTSSAAAAAVDPSPACEASGAEEQEQTQQERPTSTLTFENFVIGDSNRMAYSMAVNVAELPGKTPLNPLFIYGKSGLGKTHLMRAIQNYICETQPYLRTVYVDSAELLSDYMDASAAHDKEKSSYRNFKTHYEDADVLLIDDIQYLQGKKQTLDIVFQIFNKLISQGKQIVLSADRAPKNIDIDERYHSRFNQGGTIDIQPPEVETKLGIVRSFIDEYRTTEGGEYFSVPEDIQEYIAENSSSNIRELKSAVTKVIYQMTYFNNPHITVGEVRTLLENHFSGGNSRNLTVEDIQKEVETFFKIKHSDLVGKSRTRNVAYARHIAIYLCRTLLDLPFGEVGKRFNRDHSTVMHSVATVENMMKNSREVQEELEALKQIIREL